MAKKRGAAAGAARPPAKRQAKQPTSDPDAPPNLDLRDPSQITLSNIPVADIDAALRFCAIPVHGNGAEKAKRLRDACSLPADQLQALRFKSSTLTAGQVWRALQLLGLKCDGAPTRRRDRLARQMRSVPATPAQPGTSSSAGLASAASTLDAASPASSPYLPRHLPLHDASGTPATNESMTDTLVRAGIAPSPDKAVLAVQFNEYNRAMASVFNATPAAAQHALDTQLSNAAGKRPQPPPPPSDDGFDELADCATDAIRDYARQRGILATGNREQVLQRLELWRAQYAAARASPHGDTVPDVTFAGVETAADRIRHLEQLLHAAGVPSSAFAAASYGTAVPASTAASSSLPRSNPASSVLSTGSLPDPIAAHTATVMRTMASELVAALRSAAAPSPATTGTASTSDDSSSAATKVKNTPSHLIVPSYDDDAALFGEKLARMIAWIPEHPKILEQSTESKVIQAEKLEIVGLVCNHDTYTDGLYRFETFIRKQLDDAGAFETDDAGVRVDYSKERIEQSRLFTLNWGKMIRSLAIVVAANAGSTLQCRAPIQLCVQRACSVTMGDACIKTMKQHHKLQAWWSSQGDPPGNRERPSSGALKNETRLSAASSPSAAESQRIRQLEARLDKLANQPPDRRNLNASNPDPPPRGILKTANGKEKEKGRNKTDREVTVDTYEPRVVGDHMVSSRHVGGANSVGMRDKTPANSKYKRPVRCTVTGCPAPDYHENWECAKAFADKTGKTMPGFHLSGQKDATAWDSDGNILSDTRDAWASMIEDGYFKKNPYPQSKAAAPDPTKVRQRP